MKTKLQACLENLHFLKFFESLTSRKEILESIDSKCKKEIAAFSAAAAAVGFIPIPMSDWPLLLIIQTTMVITIALHLE